MAGGAISWKSKLQTTVATSSTEAEYMAASDAAREAVWLRRLLGDLGMDVCFQILVDNSGALFQVQNDAITQKSKHVDVHFHYVKTVVRHGKVMFAACSTAEQAADFLNKCLPKTSFLYCCQKCGMQ
jgi:hypothetical protein